MMRSFRWGRTASLLAGMAVAGTAVAAPQATEYPLARRDDTVNDYFGTKVAAPYQWMEQLDDPALSAWVARENRLTKRQVAGFGGHDWVLRHLTALEDVPSQSVPIQAGDKLFYRTNSGLQDQSVLKMRAVDGTADSAVTLIDPNTLSGDGQIALLSYQPSEDGRYVAYGLSQGGSDWETLHVLDTRRNKPTDDVVRWVKFSGISWTKDGKGFFYSRYPEPKGDSAIADKVSVQSLYYHHLGTPQSDDTLIFTRPKLENWVVGGQVSDDGRYLWITLNQGTLSSNALYVVDLGKANAPDITAKPHPLYTANDAKYQPIGHDGDTLYLLTDRGAKNGRIVVANMAEPAPEHWRVIVPEGRSVIDGATIAGDSLLVSRLVDVKSRIDIYATSGKHEGQLPVPGIGSVGSIHARAGRDTVYYGFSSYLNPGSILRYTLGQNQADTLFSPDVPFDASRYTTEQVFYRSKDGTRIPMFIVHAKGLEYDGAHPTVLYAYGGFDVSITPYFSKSIATWLDMGGVYAVANIRGGGEYGQAWHHAGMQNHKQNVFDDFAAAARYLVSHKYTRTSRLGIEGYSNGGLLVGASITQHPELFGAAYAGAGVQDMLRYQKFSGGALWAPEYGTSDNKQAFDWLIDYSPLANVKSGVCYPPTIITTADHDDRVVPSHSYKFAAKLQYAQAHDKNCSAPVLLRVDTQTSHNYMPTDKRIARSADVLSFMAMHLGAQAPADDSQDYDTGAPEPSAVHEHDTR